MYEYQYSASKIYKLFIISSLLYFYNVLLYQLFNRRHVGMADEADSKSVVGNYVWVQVPLPAPDHDNPNPVPIGDGFGFLVYLC